MKKELKQTVKIVVLGIITLVLLILTVLELLPQKTTALEIKEEITVSSLLTDAANGAYNTVIDGCLLNDSGKSITVDALNVTVKNRTGEKTIRIPLNQQIVARGEYIVAYAESDTVIYDYVDRVEAEIDGESYAISSAKDSSIGAVALILIACILLFGFLLYRSILVRYYMHQEAQMKQD